MKYLGLFGFLLLFATHSFAMEFEDIVLQGLEKERVSSSYYRFSQKNSETSIHIQAEKFDPKHSWQPETLDKDVSAMFKKRKTLYSILGFSDPKLDSFSYENNTLTLRGSYKKLSGKLVYFEEKNFYHARNFLQLKILSPEKKDSAFNEKIIRELKPFSISLDDENSTEDNND